MHHRDCEAALQRVLDSEYFSGSRRRSELLAYTGKAALAGRAEIDQYEIAEKVLGLRNFDPVDDASVRKLATQLRHKLEEYYAGPGAADSIVLSLPRHSYVLRFRPSNHDNSRLAADEPETEREGETGAPAPESLHNAAKPGGPEAASPVERGVGSGPARMRWMLIGTLLGAAPFCLWLLLANSRLEYPGAGLPQDATVIQTRQGDIRGKEMDVAPGAVQLGPEIADGEEATVRLRFTPQYATQQAGLMAMFDADNYVRLGPQFKNRTLMEFGIEKNAVFDQGPSSAYAFDPLGQTGLPRWLAVRRQGDEYSGYLSPDGFAWAPFGSRITLPSQGKNPRAAIYAFNGRSNNPPATAVFDDFGAGVSFHNRPNGAFHAAEFEGWEEATRCGAPVEATVRSGALEVSFGAEPVGCRWMLTKAAPAGDWAFSAFIDFEPVSGSSLGVAVRGSKGNTSVSRRDLGGQTLAFQRADDRDVRIPDFPGTPPVVLRVEKRGSAIRASVSCDRERFVTIPGEVRVSDLGEAPRIGVIASIAHWAGQASRPAARVYWMRLEPLALKDLAPGNVPARSGT